MEWPPTRSVRKLRIGCTNSAEYSILIEPYAKGFAFSSSSSRFFMTAAESLIFLIFCKVIPLTIGIYAMSRKRLLTCWYPLVHQVCICALVSSRSLTITKAAVVTVTQNTPATRPVQPPDNPIENKPRQDRHIDMVKSIHRPACAKGCVPSACLCHAGWANHGGNWLAKWIDVVRAHA